MLLGYIECHSFVIPVNIIITFHWHHIVVLHSRRGLKGMCTPKLLLAYYYYSGAFSQDFTLGRRNWAPTARESMRQRRRGRWELGKKCPPPELTRGMEERRGLPQRGPEQSPGRQRIFRHRPLTGIYCACPRRDGQAELTWVAGHKPR